MRRTRSIKTFTPQKAFEHFLHTLLNFLVILTNFVEPAGAYDFGAAGFNLYCSAGRSVFYKEATEVTILLRMPPSFACPFFAGVAGSRLSP